ncbi:hypothetical protein D3C75_1203020 [compost metagenome]
MPGGCTGEGKPGIADLIPPVLLADFLAAYPPPLQVSPDPKRHNEHAHLILQLSDRAIIEVVVMIMGEQNSINAGECGNLDR